MGDDRLRYRTSVPYLATRNFSSSTGESGSFPDYTHVDRVEVHHDKKERFNRKGKYYPWHPCSHGSAITLPGRRPVYREYDFFGFQTRVVAYGGSWMPYEWAQYPVDNLTNMMGGSIDTNDGLLPSDVAGRFSREALRSITEQIPTQVSIANFLWELKEGLGALLPRVGNFLQTVAGGFLWWQFGALPFVRDLKALIGSVAAVNKRLAFLKKVNGKRITNRWRSHWSNPAAGHAPAGPGWGGTGEWDQLSINGIPALEWDEWDLHLNVRTYYNLNLGGADVFLQAMCSALGLRDPAQIVWEAIPFSFVIDWFYNLQDWLEDHIDTSQPFEGEIQIEGSDHTLRRKCMINHYVLTELRNGLALEFEPFAQTLVRAYHRRAGTFGGVIDASTPGLTPIQQLLAIALIAQGLGGQPYHRR